jgi:hypothetical protein
MKPDLGNVVDCAVAGLILIGVTCLAAAFVTVTIKFCLQMFE